jgi:hypothetical protein
VHNEAPSAVRKRGHKVTRADLQRLKWSAASGLDLKNGRAAKGWPFVAGILRWGKPHVESVPKQLFAQAEVERAWHDDQIGANLIDWGGPPVGGNGGLDAAGASAAGRLFLGWRGFFGIDAAGFNRCGGLNGAAR